MDASQYVPGASGGSSLGGGGFLELQRQLEGFSKLSCRVMAAGDLPSLITGFHAEASALLGGRTSLFLLPSLGACHATESTVRRYDSEGHMGSPCRLDSVAVDGGAAQSSTLLRSESSRPEDGVPSAAAAAFSLGPGAQCPPGGSSATHSRGEQQQQLSCLDAGQSASLSSTRSLVVLGTSLQGLGRSSRGEAHNPQLDPGAVSPSNKSLSSYAVAATGAEPGSSGGGASCAGGGVPRQRRSDASQQPPSWGGLGSPAHAGASPEQGLTGTLGASAAAEGEGGGAPHGGEGGSVYPPAGGAGAGGVAMRYPLLLRGMRNRAHSDASELPLRTRIIMAAPAAVGPGIAAAAAEPSSSPPLGALVGGDPHAATANPPSGGGDDPADQLSQPLSRGNSASSTGDGQRISPRRNSAADALGPPLSRRCLPKQPSTVTEVKLSGSGEAKLSGRGEVAGGPSEAVLPSCGSSPSRAPFPAATSTVPPSRLRAPSPDGGLTVLEAVSTTLRSLTPVIAPLHSATGPTWSAQLMAAYASNPHPRFLSLPDGSSQRRLHSHPASGGGGEDEMADSPIALDGGSETPRAEGGMAPGAERRMSAATAPCARVAIVAAGDVSPKTALSTPLQPSPRMGGTHSTTPSPAATKQSQQGGSLRSFAPLQSPQLQPQGGKPSVLPPTSLPGAAVTGGAAASKHRGAAASEAAASAGSAGSISSQLQQHQQRGARTGASSSGAGTATSRDAISLGVQTMQLPLQYRGGDSTTPPRAGIASSFTQLNPPVVYSYAATAPRQQQALGSAATAGLLPELRVNPAIVSAARPTAVMVAGAPSRGGLAPGAPGYPAAHAQHLSPGQLGAAAVASLPSLHASGASQRGNLGAAPLGVGDPPGHHQEHGSIISPATALIGAAGAALTPGGFRRPPSPHGSVISSGTHGSGGGISSLPPVSEKRQGAFAVVMPVTGDGSGAGNAARPASGKGSRDRKDPSGNPHPQGTSLHAASQRRGGGTSRVEVVQVVLTVPMLDGPGPGARSNAGNQQGPHVLPPHHKGSAALSIVVEGGLCEKDRPESASSSSSSSSSSGAGSASFQAEPVTHSSQLALTAQRHPAAPTAAAAGADAGAPNGLLGVVTLTCECRLVLEEGAGALPPLAALLRQQCAPTIAMLQAAASVFMAAYQRIMAVEVANDAHRRAMGLVEVVRTLSEAADTHQIVSRIMNVAYDLTGADRISVFLVDQERGELIVAVSEDAAGLRIPMSKGIVGAVAVSGTPMNIPDAYQCPLFDTGMDAATGYVTKQILATPVRGPDGIGVVAVIQAINKRGDVPFSHEDAHSLEVVAQTAGVALHKASLLEEAVASREAKEALVEVVRIIHQDEYYDGDGEGGPMGGGICSGAESLTRKVVALAHHLVDADRITLFLVDEAKEEVYCLVPAAASAGAGAASGNNTPDSQHPPATPIAAASTLEGYIDASLPLRLQRAPLSTAGIAGSVARSGLPANIRDATQDPLFLQSMDDSAPGAETHSLLAVPVRLSGTGRIVAVIQAVNKGGGRSAFTASDESLLVAFGTEVGGVLERRSLQLAYEKAVAEETAGDGEAVRVSSLLGQYMAATAGMETASGGVAGSRSVRASSARSVRVPLTPASTSGGAGHAPALRALHLLQVAPPAAAPRYGSRHSATAARPASASVAAEIFSPTSAELGSTTADGSVARPVRSISIEDGMHLAAPAQQQPHPAYLQHRRASHGTAGSQHRHYGGGSGSSLVSATTTTTSDLSLLRGSSRKLATICSGRGDCDDETESTGASSRASNSGRLSNSGRQERGGGAAVAGAPADDATLAAAGPQLTVQVIAAPEFTGMESRGSGVGDSSDAASDSDDSGASTPREGHTPRFSDTAFTAQSSSRSLRESTTPSVPMGTAPTPPAEQGREVGAPTESQSLIVRRVTTPMIATTTTTTTSGIASLTALLTARSTGTGSSRRRGLVRIPLAAVGGGGAAPGPTGSLAGPSLTPRSHDLVSLVSSERYGSASTDASNGTQGGEHGVLSASPRDVMRPWLSICHPVCRQDVLRRITRLEFDVLAASGEELQLLPLDMIRAFGLDSELNLDMAALGSFVHAVRESYGSNPYHNWRHGLSVAHFVFLALWRTRACAEVLDPLERLAALLAALCHDVDHPGVNNAFESAFLTERAIRYNDVSVLEQHHSATMFTLLKSGEVRGTDTEGRPLVSILRLPRADFARFRRIAIAGILATDMARHGELTEGARKLHAAGAAAAAAAATAAAVGLETHRPTSVGTPSVALGGAGTPYVTSDGGSGGGTSTPGGTAPPARTPRSAAPRMPLLLRTDSRVAAGQPPLTARHGSGNSRTPAVAVAALLPDVSPKQLVELLVHAADLSNPVLPSFPVVQTWADLVCQEFMAQAASEKAAGLPCAPHMEGLTTPPAVAKLQLGFIDYVCSPLWLALTSSEGVLPELAECATNMARNRASWKAMAEAPLAISAPGTGTGSASAGAGTPLVAVKVREGDSGPAAAAAASTAAVKRQTTTAGGGAGSRGAASPQELL